MGGLLPFGTQAKEIGRYRPSPGMDRLGGEYLRVVV